MTAHSFGLVLFMKLQLIMMALARIAMVNSLATGISMKISLITVDTMSLLMVATLVCGITIKTPLSLEPGRRMMGMLRELGMLKRMHQ